MKVSLGRYNITDQSGAHAFLAHLELIFEKIPAGDYVVIGGGQAIRKHMSATTTWNPGNLNNGTQTTTTVTVNGARLGDEVTCSFDKDLQGMQLTGYVSADDTITVVLRNGTGGALDLAEGTLRASAWKH